MAEPEFVTVGELIDRLKEHDPALPVFVRDYEDGADPPVVKAQRLCVSNWNAEKNAPSDWYYGIADNPDHAWREHGPPFDAVVLWDRY